MGEQETRGALYAALHGTYAQAAAEAVASGQQPSHGELAASSGLSDAAQAHVAGSRSLDKILAEYVAAVDAVHDGDGDADAMGALGDELAAVRMATAILAGSYPVPGGTSARAGT
jgi:hypothetical protein